MDPAALTASTVYANVTQNAFVVLVKCLTDNGPLKPGQFSTAIKSLLSEADSAAPPLSIFSRSLPNA